VRQLKWLQNERKAIEARLEDLISEQGLGTRFRFLRSVPGVGRIVAATYLLEIFNLERFAKAEDLTSYLGLAPVVSQSGSSRGKANLRQVGQSRLRSLLIEAAWIFKRKDQAAGEFYNRILARTGNFAKAICAVARKLAIVMWRVALEGRCYKLSTI
jgi:transposase